MCLLEHIRNGGTPSGSIGNCIISSQFLWFSVFVMFYCILVVLGAKQEKGYKFT